MSKLFSNRKRKGVIPEKKQQPESLEWMDIDDMDDDDIDDEDIEDDDDIDDEDMEEDDDVDDEEDIEEDDEDIDEDEDNIDEEDNFDDDDEIDGEDEEEDDDTEDDIEEDDEEDDFDYDDVDEEDEEDDEEDDEEEEVAKRSRKKPGKARPSLKKTSLSDVAVIFTGVLVVVFGIIVGVLYFGAKSDEKQVAAFAEIGEGLEDIPVIGEKGLLAIMDAQAAAILVAEELEEIEAEITQQDEETGNIEVALNLTSIQKDLKIKFVNKNSGKLVTNVPFTVEIKPPKGDAYTLKDEDEDGVIYETDIAGGKYTVVITGPKNLDGYGFSEAPEEVTVKDTIEYKKVEVADEIKSEAQVNAAVEDTAVNDTVVESANTDTVEWVESTKTLIEGTESTVDEYEEVSKDEITDPSSGAAAGTRLFADSSFLALFKDMIADINPVSTTDDDDDDDEGGLIVVPSEDETPTPTPADTGDETPTPTASSDETPTPTATPEETEAPLVPVETPTPKTSPKPSSDETPTPTPTAIPTDEPTATPKVTPTPKGKKPSASPSETPKDKKDKGKGKLKSNSGEQMYVLDESGNYREAGYDDYYNSQKFYRKIEKTTGEYRYTGWQVIDGATYFFDKNGNKVTGQQVIQGAKYTFNDNGVLSTGSGQMGIDVSKWNGKIDWKAVKNSGVSYAIIRCGYRGSATGALVEDPLFRANIQGAQNAGIKVGIYFFTQAVNEVEAVEEASMVISLIRGYNISYPVFLDVESTSGNNGRADHISVDARTAVCKAFCQTIQNSGYKAGIYANKTWFTSYINTPSLTGYRIWLAQYAAAPSYTRTKYDLWQYSSKGRISGIGTNVDLNISYLGY